jgi:hypothetical protein
MAVWHSTINLKAKRNSPLSKWRRGGRLEKTQGECWEKGLVQEGGNVDNVDNVVTATASPWFLVWAHTLLVRK